MTAGYPKDDIVISDAWNYSDDGSRMEIRWLKWRENGHNLLPDLFYEIVDIEVMKNPTIGDKHGSH